MQDSRMYSLNRVAVCKIAPDNLYVAPATITLYQKSYRTTLSATVCSVKVRMIRFNCGLFSHSSIVHDQNMITYELIVTPEMCKAAFTSGNLKVTLFEENFDVPVAFNRRKQSKFNSGVETRNTVYCNKGQVKHYTFETFMPRLNLTFTYGTKEVPIKDGKKLPCLLMEGGCETTTIDPFAYTWNTPESCVMTKVLTQNAKMLLYPLTADEKENQFFFFSEFNDTIENGMNLNEN